MAATDPLCRSFLDLWWHFDPGGTTAGRLGDFGTEAVRRHTAALRAIGAAVEELDVTEVADEIDRTALLDHIRVQVFRLEHEDPYRINPRLWTDHLIRCFEFPDVPEPLAAAAALERLRALPAFCRTAVETLRKPVPVLVAGAIAQLAQIARHLEVVRHRFGPAWSPGPEPTGSLVAEARSALAELESALEEQIAPDSDPRAGSIGAAEADRRLHYEHASIHNSGEVWRGTLRLAAEVEQEVIARAAAINPAPTWRELFGDLIGEPLPPSGLTEAFTEWRNRAREFALARDLISPPEESDDPVRIEFQVQSGHPWIPWDWSDAAAGRPARIETAPFAPALMPWIAARLGEPGLLYRYGTQQRLPGLVRRHIAAGSSTGGWALAAQELMADSGFRPEPESLLVERVIAFRDVQLALVDIGFHTGQFTAEEAIAQLTSRLPIEPSVARAEVQMVLTCPLRAAAALLGQQELRRLRQDYLDTREGSTLAVFHQELGGYGALPLPLVRWGMGLDA